jgi:hypothetical protein
VALAVKSARRRLPIFRQAAQLVADKGFLSSCEAQPMEMLPLLTSRVTSV